MSKVLLCSLFLLCVSNAYCENMPLAYCPSFVKCNSSGPCYAFDNQGIWSNEGGNRAAGIYKLVLVQGTGTRQQGPKTRFECTYRSNSINHDDITFISQGLFAVDMSIPSKWEITRSTKLNCLSDNAKDCPLIGDKGTVYGMQIDNFSHDYISFRQATTSDSSDTRGPTTRNLYYEALLKEDCPSFPIYHYKVFAGSAGRLLIGEVDLDLSIQGVIQIIDVRPAKTTTICKISQKTPFNIIGCL
ncbi:MAG: hypothetical protein NTZ86_09750 [Legionellales bacterium]|nr:hypothetical protein [Legionellales bacterium]